MLFSQMLMAWSYISLKRRRWAQKSLFRMLIRKWRYNKGYSVWVGVQYGGTSSLGLCARSLSSWPNARWLANRAPSLEGKRGADRSDYKIKGQKLDWIKHQLWKLIRRWLEGKASALASKDWLLDWTLFLLRKRKDFSKDVHFRSTFWREFLLFSLKCPCERGRRKRAKFFS